MKGEHDAHLLTSCTAHTGDDCPSTKPASATANDADPAPDNCPATRTGTVAVRRHRVSADAASGRRYRRGTAPAPLPARPLRPGPLARRGGSSQAGGSSWPVAAPDGRRRPAPLPPVRRPRSPGFRRGRPLHTCTSRATTSPMCSAASRTILRAAGSPCRIRRANSCSPVRASSADSVREPGRAARSRSSRPIIAAADATASTQPVLPQRHTTSSAPRTGRCPISPAAPSAPRCSSPRRRRAPSDSRGHRDEQQRQLVPR